LTTKESNGQHPPHPCENCGIYHTHYDLQVNSYQRSNITNEEIGLASKPLVNPHFKGASDNNSTKGNDGK